MGLSLLLKLTTLMLCLFGNSGSESHSNVQWDYCVIGAGPGGLQMGYFLDRAARNYIIFEKGNTSGTFFQFYPRHRKLISINKRHTGKTNKEFNLRHDWNSLISDDETLQMRHYSKEFFPHADDYVRYLKDYSERLGLKIQYNTVISNISRHGPNSTHTDYFTMLDQENTMYTCKYVIVATGVSIPRVPNFSGVELSEGYESLSLDREEFEGQSVLILGRGNSAFETADHIIGSTSVIHMMARSRVRLAWATHYVGDLRAVNNGLLDTYQLKSLDGIIEGDVHELLLTKASNGKILLDISDSFKFKAPVHMTNNSNEEEYIIPDNFPLRDSYDRVIRCLGFQFDFKIFDNDTRPGSRQSGKYPRIKPDYEADGIPGLYFAGTNSHSLDFRKSAGGFIHGFRYTARALHRTLEYRNHQVPWPSVNIQPITGLLDHIIKRMNEASGLYQMFVILADVVILHRNGMEFEYLEEFPLKMIHKLEEMTGRRGDEYIVIAMEYGKHFSGPGEDIFRSERATGEPQEAHTSNFLHPVLYYYKSLPTEEDMKNIEKSHDVLPTPHALHHIVEDFLTDWTAPISHVLVLRRFLETVLKKDLRNFWNHQCFELALTYDTLPVSCQRYLHGHSVPGNEELWNLAHDISV